jgi:hypothetical protein
MTGGRGRRRDWARTSCSRLASGSQAPARSRAEPCRWGQPEHGARSQVLRQPRRPWFRESESVRITGGSCSLAGAAGGGTSSTLRPSGQRRRGDTYSGTLAVFDTAGAGAGAWEFATGGARPGGRARLNSILSAYSPRREARVRCAHWLGPRPRAWGRDRKARVPGRPRAALVCRRLRRGSRLLEPLRRSGERRDLLRARRRPALGLSGGRSRFAMTTVEKAPRPALLFPDPGR